MDIPLIMEVLALSYLKLLVPIRSICLLQRHWGHLCPCRDIHHQGPAAQRDTHTTEAVGRYWEPKDTYLSLQCWSLLTLVSAPRPVAAGTCPRCAGAPGWGSCRCRSRRVPSACSPAAPAWASPCQRLHYLCTARWAGEKHSSTLQWWMCYVQQTYTLNKHTHTHTLFSAIVAVLRSHRRETHEWTTSTWSHLFKRRRKKQKKWLRYKDGTQVHLYRSLCLYGLPQPRQTLNSTVSSSKNPGMLLTARTSHPQYICYYFLGNVQICNRHS